MCQRARLPEPSAWVGFQQMLTKRSELGKGCTCLIRSKRSAAVRASQVTRCSPLGSEPECASVMKGGRARDSLIVAITVPVVILANVGALVLYRAVQKERADGHVSSAIQREGITTVGTVIMVRPPRRGAFLAGQVRIRFMTEAQDEVETMVPSRRSPMIGEEVEVRYVRGNPTVARLSGDEVPNRGRSGRSSTTASTRMARRWRRIVIASTAATGPPPGRFVTNQFRRPGGSGGGWSTSPRSRHDRDISTRFRDEGEDRGRLRSTRRCRSRPVSAAQRMAALVTARPAEVAEPL
jgi:hypothetical protein